MLKLFGRERQTGTIDLTSATDAPENNTTEQSSPTKITEINLGSLQSSLEDIAIKVGTRISTQFSPKSTPEEKEQLVSSALEEVATSLLYFINSRTGQDDQPATNKLDDAAVSFVLENYQNYWPTIKLVAELNSATKRAIIPKHTQQEIQKQLEETQLTVDTRAKIASSLIEPIVNSYARGDHESDRKIQSVRNCAKILLPEPTEAFDSTDPIVIANAAFIATDRAIYEAREAKNFSGVSQKIIEASELNYVFNVANASLKEAAKQTGSTAETITTSNRAEQIKLIITEGLPQIEQPALKNNATEKLAEIKPTTAWPRLVKFYSEQVTRPSLDEALVSQVPTKQEQTSQKIDLKAQTETSEENQDDKPKNSNHTARNIGVTATAVVAGVSSIINPSVANATPIRSGSVAASNFTPSQLSEAPLVITFPAQDESQPANNDSPEKPEHQAEPTLGISEGEQTSLNAGEQGSQDFQNIVEPTTANTKTAVTPLEGTELGVPSVSLNEQSDEPPSNATSPTETKPESTPTETIDNNPTPEVPDSAEPTFQPEITPAPTEPITTEPITDETIISTTPEQTVTIGDIFNTTDQQEPTLTDETETTPVETTPPAETDQPPIPVSTEPAVSVYAAEPTTAEATEAIVVSVNPEQVSSETPVQAPKATEQMNYLQYQETVGDKSDAHKLAAKISSESPDLSQQPSNLNNISSYLEDINNKHLTKMLGSINNQDTAKQATKDVNKLVAYAKIISQHPDALEDENFKAEIDYLLRKTPAAYKDSPALYAVLLANSKEKVASDQNYLNYESTGSTDADNAIQLLTTAAVATASNKAMAKLPSLDDSLEYETGQSPEGNYQKAEFHPNEQALIDAVDKYAEPSIKNSPEKLNYFKKLVVAIAKEAAKSHADVNLAVVAAQGIVETGWGEAAHGNNLFGIKAGSDWTGPTFNSGTQESVNGNLINITDKFREYGSSQESVADRLKLVGPGHENFEKGCASTPDTYLRSLQGKTGNDPKCRTLVDGVLAYATDDNYEAKIKSIITSNNIEQIFVEGGLGNYADKIYAEAKAKREANADRTNRDSGKLVEEAVPHGRQVAEQAREWVKNDPKCGFTDDKTCHNRCLNIVRKLWNAVGLEDGLKDPTALDAYKRYKSNGWVNKKGPIPVGAIMWSKRKTGDPGAGHVFVYLGNGKAASNIGYNFVIVDLNDENSIYDSHQWDGWSEYHG